MISIFTFTITIGNTESDEDKFRRLYDKYYELTYKLVCTKVYNKQIIKDVMQDIWLKIWSTIDKARAGSERAWIVTLTCHIAINESIKDCRQRLTYPVPDEDYFIESLTDDGGDPADIVAGNETVEYIYKEIKQMDEKYAYVLTMNLHFRCTPQEIADLGNISLKTVYTQLNRGKAMLREKLKEVGLWETKEKETTK